MYTGGRGRSRAGHHQRGGSVTSTSGRTAELSSAYASLATELTRKEIKTVGGYTLGRVIGEGAFGKVHIGVHRLTNTRVAIKQVPKSLPFTSDPCSPLSLLTREIHHHRRLRHPHLLALYEILATETSIYLVSELCTGGELFDYLVEKGRLSPLETRRIFGQLVLGVGALHGAGVVHRDLKLENVLLDENVNVKIADLGFGREFEKGRWMETWVGSLGYSAPEMVAAKRYLGEEVDIWSLGVILFTLLSGSLPFDDDDEAVMKQKILECDYDMPAWIDEDAADLIQGILQLDPLRRLSLKAILSHKFFTRPSSSLDVNPVPSTPTLPSTNTMTSAPNFPPPIPEEGNCTPESTSEEHRHLQGASELSSDGTWFSAASESGASTEGTSDADERRSGATTPITSEDGSTGPPPGLGPVMEGKGTQEEESEDGANLRLLHRNGSETTIKRDTGDESAPSSSTEATPRGPPRGRSLLPTSTEEGESDEDGVGLGHPGRSGSAASLRAPQLCRNVSSSSCGSFGSQGGSPVAVHTRTPSRTKRHSVGSMFSERLFSLDEEPIVKQVDYLAQLSEAVPAPLSTQDEKDLLDSLTTLGFDTGQIVHSVMTDACDASGAIWWMLKRKADQRSRERKEAEAINDEILAKSEKKKPGGGLFDVGARTKTEEPVVGFLEDESFTHSGIEAHRESMATLKLSPQRTPERSPSINTPTSDDGDRQGYFQINPGSVSAPLLPFYPSSAVDAVHASPTKGVPRSKSKDHLSATNGTAPPTTPDLTTLVSKPSSPGGASIGSDLSSTKSKRGRSTSVSMLQRATSVLGNSLALKKSIDVVKDELGKNEEVRSTTPTLAGLFHRKSSVVDVAPDTSTPSPSTSPSKRSEPELHESPATPARKSLPLPTPQPSPAVSHSGSHDTFDTVTSSSSQQHLPTSSNAPATKKGTRGNLFSNFKMWFGDDRRKRKRASVPSPSHVESSASLRIVNSTHTLRRGMQPDGSYVNSPLKRPPIGSRRSSNGSLVPVSRRSSTNSMSRTRSREPGLTSPALGHRRRQSDSSRASTSDQEVSRPPSLRSVSGNEATPHRRHTHHGHTSSQSSSSTTFRPHIPVQAKDVYRRPPTTTTVRRHHGSSARHSRNRSGGSSVTPHSSSSSIGAEDAADMEALNGEAIIDIIEEDESVFEERSASPLHLGGAEDSFVDCPLLISESSTPRTPEESHRATEERERALRKLSGEFKSDQQHSRVPRLSMDSHQSRGSKLSLDSHHSSNSGHSHHSNVVFAAHKTRHVFGSPSQPVPSSIAHHHHHHHAVTRKPAKPSNLRDVFATKDADGEWVDEADEFGGYGGGLGQASSNAARASDKSGATSPFFASSHTSTSLPAGTLADSDHLVAPAPSPSLMFESRYAAVGAQQSAAGETSRRTLGSRPPTFRGPVVIEEDEEDEED